MGHNLKFKKMEIPEAIKLIQEMKSWMPSDNKNFDKEREAIDTVVAELENPLPSDDEAGTMAASIASKSKPNLTAQEEAFFVAGFIECVKWMRYLREEETK